MSEFTYKIADNLNEFEQIYRLNYETFVCEVSQHSPNEDLILIDRFDNENQYFICLKGDILVAMIAIRDKRPFSLDLKIPDFEKLLPKFSNLCEIRLLSVKSEFRRSKLLYNLLEFTAKINLAKNYDMAVISGIVNQQRLYKHIGFIPFGNLLGTEKASFVPMYLTLRNFLKHASFVNGNNKCVKSKSVLNFLPGPVNVCQEVRNVFLQPTISHRSTGFKELLLSTKKLLCQLVKAQYVEIMLGSGTLANDAVAAQLGQLNSRGLILTNGEFGNRLIDHAQRFKLEFDVISEDWGKSYNFNKVEDYLSLKENFDIKWLWSTHCETSTGVENNIKKLQFIANKHNVLLCLDCISSIGAVDVNLKDVYLATAVSGKGIGSLSGLSMVFLNHQVKSSKDIPKYLDIGYYAAKEGVPFTSCSNYIEALKMALLKLNITERFAKIKLLSGMLKRNLSKLGFIIIAEDKHSSPVVHSISHPNIDVKALCEYMESKNFILHYNNAYLLERNWFQISLMSEHEEENILCLVQAISFFISKYQRNLV